MDLPFVPTGVKTYTNGVDSSFKARPPPPPNDVIDRLKNLRIVVESDVTKYRNALTRNTGEDPSDKIYLLVELIGKIKQYMSTNNYTPSDDVNTAIEKLKALINAYNDKQYKNKIQLTQLTGGGKTKRRKRAKSTKKKQHKRK
jgi:hypothetical protein